MSAGAIPLALLEAITAAFTGTPILGGPQSNRVAERMPVVASIERALASGDNATVTIYGSDLQNIHSAVNCQGFRGDGTTSQFSCTGAVDGKGGAPGTGALYLAWSNNNYVVLLGGQVVPFQPVQGQTYAGYTITDKDGGTNAAKAARVNFKQGTGTGDGATTAFNTAIADAARTLTGMQLVVQVAGVTKTLTTDYTVSASGGQTVVTFTTAPANSAAITFSLIPANGVVVEVYQVTPDTLLATTAAGTAFKDAPITARKCMWAVVAGSTVGATNVYIKPLSN